MQFKKIALYALLGLSFLVKVPQAFAVPDDGTDSLVEVPVNGQSQDVIGNMLLQSISLMGIPYKWGGNTPQTGMDCSGFIRYVFQKSLGITLPRTAAEMAKVGKRVGLDELEPGDLLFFNTGRGSNTHVGMYIGNNKFIQSPRTGDNIKITEFNSYWRGRVNGAKRIVQENINDNGDTTVESYQTVNDEALPVKAGYSRSKHNIAHISRRGRSKANNHQKHRVSYVKVKTKSKTTSHATKGHKKKKH